MAAATVAAKYNRDVRNIPSRVHVEGRRFRSMAVHGVKTCNSAEEAAAAVKQLEARMR